MEKIREKYKAEYNSWNSMKQRCYDKNTRSAPRYMLRGIIVCDRWLNSFEDFLSDMGPRPTKTHSIERINNDGNYEPTNCKWETKKRQSRNTSTNRVIEYNGDRLTMIELSEKYNLPYYVVSNRVRKNWTLEKVFTTPVLNSIRKITYYGEETTFKKLALKTGIKHSRLYKRVVRFGYTPEEAVKFEQKDIFLTHNGETRSLVEWAKIKGLKRSTLYARIYIQKADIETALNAQLSIGGVKLNKL